MDLVSPTERLVLGLRIVDLLDVLDRAVAACPDFAELENQHKAIVLMNAWLEQPPLVNGAKLSPQAINWDRIMEFIEFILPLLLRIWGL